MTYEDIERANSALHSTRIERYSKKTGKREEKDYIDVSQRIKAFRMLYPEGYIKTEILAYDDKSVTIKARCGYIEDGVERDLGQGTAREEKDASTINSTSYVENCETSAVGRALGMAGLGIIVDQATEDDDTHADSPVISKDKDAVIVDLSTGAEAPAQASKPPARKASQKQIAIIKTLPQDRKATLCRACGVDCIEALTVQQASIAVEKILKEQGGKK